MTCELYRHFNQAGELVYVGISNNAVLRTNGHKGGSRWFDQVVRIDIERYPSRAEALIAEENAILTEKPMFNLRYGKRYGAASRNPEMQKDYEAALAEAAAKNIRVQKNRCAAGIRAQVRMAEQGVRYPYDFDDQFRWERETGKKLHLK